jgi:multisubunit Na+/H+ antiporter MnhG subunit
VSSDLYYITIIIAVTAMFTLFSHLSPVLCFILLLLNEPVSAAVIIRVSIREVLFFNVERDTGYLH